MLAKRRAGDTLWDIGSRLSFAYNDGIKSGKRRTCILSEYVSLTKGQGIAVVEVSPPSDPGYCKRKKGQY